jgi:hypothetical protein
MKKYLYGSWTVLKNYLFAMIFFYLFIVGFYTKSGLFSVAIFIVMFLLIYNELVHLTGIDKRKFGAVRLYEGAVYGLIAVMPFAIIQIIISQLNLSIKGIDFFVLRSNLMKGFLAPMLFIARSMHYSLAGYIIAWSTIVLAAFLGYFAGCKGFDLSVFTRKLFGLQPRKRKPTKNNRRI